MGRKGEKYLFNQNIFDEPGIEEDDIEPPPPPIFSEEELDIVEHLLQHMMDAFDAAQAGIEPVLDDDSSVFDESEDDPDQENDFVLDRAKPIPVEREPDEN